MSKSHLTKLRMAALAATVIVLAVAAVLAQAPGTRGQGAPTGRGQAAPEPPSAMVNPYRMIEKWPNFGEIRSGAAIGIIPDGKGGTWLHHRSEPPILHIDASGAILKSFGDKMFVQAHGFCQDSRHSEHSNGGRKRSHPEFHKM